MCGIFGLVADRNSGLTPSLFRLTANELFKLSESRGKESAGVALVSNGSVYVYKQPTAASRMIHSHEYKQRIESKIRGNGLFENKESYALVGHSRLVTNGTQENHDNNQPVVTNGIIGVHNGIIVNDREIWERFPDLKRQFDVDTEVILSLMRHFLEETGSVIEAAQRVYRTIKGNASVALLFEDLDMLLLATNNGSLYALPHGDGQPYVFASEKYILTTLAHNRHLQHLLSSEQVIRIHPGIGHLVDLRTLNVTTFSLFSSDDVSGEPIIRTAPRSIIDLTPEEIRVNGTAKRGFPTPGILSRNDRPELLFTGEGIVDHIRRCRRCILPETFPFIQFDGDGVCSICNSYRPRQSKDPSELEHVLARYRKNSAEPDCLLMFSGGRDSSYAVHYVKNVLGMNPVTYTYDWGMVTDLARRNISRMCGQLGVENVLVSADIARKRKNIQKNVVAWLKKPDLGMVPLFTAGDKHYFYYANRLKRQMEIDLTVLSASPFEKTHFKHGFCGVPPFATHRPTWKDQVQILKYYAQRLLENPAYINTSMVDNMSGFLSYFQIPHNYLRLYDYIAWNEDEITRTLLEQYDWEVAEDTPTTWRIGDGTAPFYNYIYHTVAGFTENDTFRSNQIREGVLSRDEALQRVRLENRPRYPSLKWYLETIGLGDSFNEIVSTINAIPRLYDAS